jgi:hypothetical protein
MRWASVAAFLGLVVGVTLVGGRREAADPGRTLNFGKADAGKLPACWTADHAGYGTGSEWEVVADDTAPSGTGHVLTQTAASPKEFVSLCVVEDTNYQDVMASVAFKSVGGSNNRGGGIVWRYQDHDNYYLARLDMRDDNFRVYKVVSGRSIELGSRDALTVPDDEWHILKIEMHGDHIRCYLDGTNHLDVHDATVKGKGKVGLWTRGNAQTEFDDFKVSGK